MKMKQIKHAIINELNERFGFEFATTTDIDHSYVVAVKLGKKTTSESVEQIVKDCTIKCLRNSL